LRSVGVVDLVVGRHDRGDVGLDPSKERVAGGRRRDRTLASSRPWEEERRSNEQVELVKSSIIDVGRLKKPIGLHLA